MIGKTLGHYQIVEQLGLLGRAEVYRARDPRVGCNVAIKVSSEQFTDRLSRLRYQVLLRKMNLEP